MLPLERISFRRSFKAILSGVAFALNTPNRIGEYGGRILYVSEGKRIRAVSLTIAGSFSQLIVTLFFGMIGIWVLRDLFLKDEYISSFSIWLKFFELILGIIILVCTMVYFRIGWIIKGVEKLPGVSAFVRHFAVLEELSVNLLIRVLSLSMGRYLVFIIQYILLLQVMHVEAGWWQGFWLVAVLFLWLAVWPTIALLELGLRWQYSMLLFTLVSGNKLGIYAAATGIWFINLVLPALAGSLLMLGIRIFKMK